MNEKILDLLRHMHETLWINPNLKTGLTPYNLKCEIAFDEILDAQDRLNRFAPFIYKAFPETRKTGGIIESPLVKTQKLAEFLDVQNVYMKLDSHLPISGSIKARGGIYEVLKHAEDIAISHNILSPHDDYSVLLDSRELFSKYSIAVGSTGNLGLSIGIMAAKFGFKVTVHMSSDAREWKKQLLRSHGCTVMEYDDDYSVAVKQGRQEAQKDPTCYFIDDENSKTLFLGYSVAALRLKRQLEDMQIQVDEKHPLYVYLPCGVGGGPGGVAFGIKQVFGDFAHCFFAEPTHSPCMTLGMATGKHNEICVGDIGLDNKTVADGLAVGRASGFVGKLMLPFTSGCFTVTDKRMLYYVAKLSELENINVEPSATAGIYGCVHMKNVKNATHIIWATGGGMVPADIFRDYIACGKCIDM